jgi:NAD(P)-dependent dehydrogenase (short-subunit alcohol dehydrogenase family)
MKNGKVVLITGATGAVGKAVSAHMAAAGYRLVLTARSHEPLIALSSQVRMDKDRVMTHPADITDSDSVHQLLKAIEEWGNGVDILVNTAGGWKGGKPLEEVTDADWDATLRLNLQTAFFINRAVIPHMVQRKWGRIINIASKAAVSPGPRQAAYNVSKAAVIALTQSISVEYRRKGIAANVILPSIIDTPTNRKQMPDADYSRWVTPGQLAELILFLCTEEGGSLNGASIPMYGTV